jgi:cytoskeletal protein CcmA (bactofilin family)
MPSTYTLNNGIELIATGEQSGTWGDTTNLNLGLVDTALDGQVTVTLPAAGTSGAPNALPISDGAASNGRNRLIIFADGGDLGATAFVQLTPNDAEKIVYIRNNLSGGRAITLFQGTYNAANDYEVPAGTTAVVFFNGGGAGAVAANVFNNAFFDSLRLGGVSVTAILDEDNMASDSATALATQQSIKAYVDAQVGANNELSEVLANGNTSGGTDIQMTTTDEVQFRDTALTIKSSVDGQLDIAADVELEIVAPTLDINASTAVTIDTTTLTMTGSVNVVGDLDVDNLNLNGNTIISTNTDGNIALTPNGTGEVDISKVDIDGGTIDGTVIGGTTPAAISGTTGQFGTSLNVDGTVTADGLTVDGNIALRNADNITFKDTGGAARGILTFDANNDIVIGPAGAGIQDIKLKNNGAITRLNIDVGGDISFYEDTGTTPKFFWDASAESLGLGTVSPSAKLEVAETDSVTYSSSAIQGDLVVSRKNLAGTVNQVVGLQFDVTGYLGTTTGVAGISAIQTSSASSAALAFQTRNAGTIGERMRIDASGNLLVGKTSADNGDTAGIEIQSDGQIFAAKSGDNVAYFNRISTDGTIVQLEKDGATVGSIGSAFSGSSMYIDGASSRTGIYFATSSWTPRINGANVDNQVDLGGITNRFDDIYATNGTIQTSDRNEKQDIEACLMQSNV